MTKIASSELTHSPLFIHHSLSPTQPTQSIPIKQLYSSRRGHVVCYAAQARILMSCYTGIVKCITRPSPEHSHLPLQDCDYHTKWNLN
jgi:hypothetical protein